MIKLMFQAFLEDDDEDVGPIQMSTGRELHEKVLPPPQTHNGIQDTCAPLNVSCLTALDPGMAAALSRVGNLSRG